MASSLMPRTQPPVWIKVRYVSPTQTEPGMMLVPAEILYPAGTVTTHVALAPPLKLKGGHVAGAGGGGGFGGLLIGGGAGARRAPAGRWRYTWLTRDCWLVELAHVVQPATLVHPAVVTEEQPGPSYASSHMNTAGGPHVAVAGTGPPEKKVQPLQA